MLLLTGESILCCFCESAAIYQWHRRRQQRRIEDDELVVGFRFHSCPPCIPTITISHLMDYKLKLSHGEREKGDEEDRFLGNYRSARSSDLYRNFMLSVFDSFDISYPKVRCNFPVAL
nr:hypothetical protein Iba_chr03dCG10850 [Ipomoea batatas]